jgi:hypothetical protein
MTNEAGEEMTQHTPRAKRQARRTIQQWHALLSQYEQSGLSQRAFCQQSAIPYSSFLRWRQRLSSRATESVDASGDGLFIELMNEAPDAPSRQPWDVELQLGEGVFLRLRQLSC